MDLKFLFLGVCTFLTLLQQGSAIENYVPDINKMTEPPEGQVKTPEEDEVWCHPEGVHLSYGNTSSQMVVMWATRGHCETQVQYADHPWDLDLQVNGTRLELEGAENKSLRFIHRAVLENLSPGETYYFRPVMQSGVGAGPFYFNTPADENFSPSFLVSNNLELERKALHYFIKESQTGKFSAMLYNGDVEDSLTPAEGERDSTFLSNIEEAAKSVPFMTVAGKKGEKDQNLYHYLHTFSMPGMDWPMPANKLWYSMDVGLVHIISYSSDVFLEPDTKNAKAQQEWLVSDLKEVNKRRAQTPWVIAVGSSPMYCSYGVVDVDDCATNSSKVRHGLEDLFYLFAVDLVIEGRHRVYERTLPQYKGVVITKSYDMPRAPVELILGSFSKEEKVEETDANDNTTAPTAAVADWSAFHLPDLTVPTYGRLSVVNMSHLFWELLSSTDQSLLDSFWIVQDSHGNFSLANLPHNISHQINQTIIAMGGKPGTYDFIDGSAGSATDTEGWSKYSLWLGLAIVGAVLLIVLGMVAVRTFMRRRRARAGRRWMEVDRDGGGAGNFYSVASDSDTDDNDFEIDVYQKTNNQSSKLLTSY